MSIKDDTLAQAWTALAKAYEHDRQGHPDAKIQAAATLAAAAALIDIAETLRKGSHIDAATTRNAYQRVIHAAREWKQLRDSEGTDRSTWLRDGDITLYEAIRELE